MVCRSYVGVTERNYNISTGACFIESSTLTPSSRDLQVNPPYSDISLLPHLLVSFPGDSPPPRSPSLAPRPVAAPPEAAWRS